MKNTTISIEDSLKSNRILGFVEGEKNKPTVVIIAGIHGNETAGVEASKKVLHKIKENNISFRGNLYVLIGNKNALSKGIRYENVDLNRIWKKEYIAAIQSKTQQPSAEVNEQIELHAIVQEILNREEGPFYFLDLHTTSSPSIPFITISDSLNNRKFSANFPVPVVLGIEEFLDGPFLTFINEFGHIALGFEGGQHNDKQSVKNCEAFVWLALAESKCVSKNAIPNLKMYKNKLRKWHPEEAFFEINYRYDLKNNEHFKMDSGFENFEPISKDQHLAKSNGEDVTASDSGRIFMPLYQELGEDGFFILQKISKFWLKLSLVARKLKINNFLRLIPGVEKDPTNSYTLIADPRIAKYYNKELFHLFGYRKQILKDDKLHFIKRDRRVTEFT